MNERIETNFEELKDYEEIECYYDYLEQAEHFFRDVFGDRVESQKYIIRANREIERLNNIINNLEKWLEEQIKICQAHDNEFGVNVCNTFKDKLKALKGDSSNE